MFLCEVLADFAGAGVEIALPTPDLVVDGDGLRLAQAVGNVVINAARFTGPGGTLQITGEMRDGRVVLRWRDSEKPLKVLVVDDNVHSARAVAEVMRLMGHEVTIVHDAPAALLVPDADVGGSTSGCPGWTATRSRARSVNAPTENNMNLIGGLNFQAFEPPCDQAIVGALVGALAGMALDAALAFTPPPASVTDPPARGAGRLAPRLSLGQAHLTLGLNATF